MSCKNLSFALIAVLLALLPVVATSQQTEAPGPAKTPALRFDGVYHQERWGAAPYYYRFFEDGTFVRWYGHPDKEPAATMKHPLRQTGKYRIQEDRIEMTVAGLPGVYDTSILKGNIERDRIEIEEERIGDFSDQKRQKWVFVPIDFAEAERRLAELERKRQAELVEQRARERTETQLAIGSAKMDKQCQAVDFTPAAEPIRFPASTTELAYQVSSIPEEGEVSVNIGNICGTRGYKTTRCNKYLIVMGRPVNTGWTAVVRCGDGKPFEPGRYKLQLFFGEEPKPANEISFEVK